MRCQCGENLGRISKSGEPMLRSKGFVMKADGVSAICPKCNADVPIAGDMARALSSRLLLVFRPPKPPPA